MQLARPFVVSHARRFGRGPARIIDAPVATAPWLSADLKLFAATFVAGFLFVSILIG